MEYTRQAPALYNGKLALGKMGIVGVRLASTSGVRWWGLNQLHLLEHQRCLQPEDTGKGINGQRWVLLGPRPPMPVYLPPRAEQMELPSRCAGPQPGSPCLGDSLVHGWHPPVPGSDPLSTSGVSEGQPHTPHWVPRAVTRTWGCRESNCCSGSLQLTAL